MAALFTDTCNFVGVFFLERQWATYRMNTVHNWLPGTGTVLSTCDLNIFIWIHCWFIIISGIMF